MALGNISGVAYVVPDDPGHPDVLPEDTKGIAKSIAARLREWGLRLTTRVDNLAARVDAMAVATGQAPGSPADGAVAGYLLDDRSKTRSALFSVLDVGPVHVSRFGAKGDGVADDTAALVAAGASGREVHFSTGVYNFRGPVAFSEGT
ncbi:glycosyl hydrolase family 28-related protein, partial [Streptomyces sp. NPDC051172]|uniref:glycosyl hydrolase family 28-related protein n=1 Tax=Streptomyces sp. NPDC051172 TaxID=3155796 RepID=UPI00342A6DF7